MTLKVMDPEIARNLIDSEEDVISPALEAEAELFKNLKCPMCYQGGCEKQAKPPKIVMTEDGPILSTPTFGDEPILKCDAHCIHCGTTFDPKTGLIYKTEASMLPSPQSDPLQE